MSEQPQDLPGRVYALEDTVRNIGQRLDTGLTEIFNKFDAYAQRTDARFETASQTQLVQAQSRSSVVWQYLFSGAGLLVALYTLVKAPVDDKFQEVEHAVVTLQQNTTPVAQVNDIKQSANTNTQYIIQMERELSAGLARVEEMSKRVDVISNRVQNIYEKNYAVPAIPCIGAGCGKQGQ